MAQVDVEVREASPADRVLIRNIFPLYLHDLTAFTDVYDVDEHGIFFPDCLYEWFDCEPGSNRLVAFHEGGRPAGFAMVARPPYAFMSAGKDFKMGEFFVLNRARRLGVGRRAAHQTFAMFQGRWEVPVLLRNTAAVSFWRRVVGEYTGGAYTETFSSDQVTLELDSRRGE